MVSRRVAIKKTAAPKKPAVKKAASPARVPRGVNTAAEKVDDTQIVWSDNEEARRLGIDNSKPANTVAKVVSLQVSVGNYDRNRNMDDFVAYINKMLKSVPYGKDGVHASVMSSYYIVDGKVCQPENYDAKKQNFKDNTIPPSWAGGPAPSKVTKPAGERASSSSAAISAKQYDAKYGPEGSPVARGKIAEQKELAKKRREGPTDDEVEEFDLEWDEDDVDNDEKMEQVARKSQAAAAKKIRVTKKTPAKKVVAPSKRRESASASTPKKTIRVRRSK